MNFSKPFVAIIAIIFTLVLVVNLMYYNSAEDVSFKVTEKERITKIVDGNDNSYYLVYTSNGVYKIKDNLWFMQFRSSDLYGSLKVDSTYNVKVVGWRIGFFSQYPNIVKIY